MSIKVTLKSFKSVLAENFNPIDFMYVCSYSALSTVFCASPGNFRIL